MTYSEVIKQIEKLGYREKLHLAQRLLQMAIKEKMFSALANARAIVVTETGEGHVSGEVSGGDAASRLARRWRAEEGLGRAQLGFENRADASALARAISDRAAEGCPW